MIKLTISIGYYIAALFGLFLIITWIFDNEPPIKFLLGSITPTLASPGDIIQVNQILEKTRTCPGEVTRILQGECGLVHISTNSAILEKGINDITIPVILPLGIKPGNCNFISQHSYICDPLDLLFNRKIYKSPNIPFKVGLR